MELRHSVLLPYAADDMFDLIEQAEQYPQFVPWCSAATILERSDDWVAARLEFSYFKFRFGFVTRNPKRRPQWLQVRLVEGPFKRFQGTWALKALGDQGCKVEFSLSCEIADGLLDLIAVPAVDKIARKMVDAFVGRAQQSLTALAPAQTVSGIRVQASAQPIAQPVEVLMSTTDPALQQAVMASRFAEGLSAVQISALAAVLRLESFATGQVLAREGTRDNHLYAVVDGSLAVVKQAGTPDQEVLAILKAGDFAHELGFLDGSERYASLVAHSDARALVLELGALERLIDAHPRVLYAVMGAIVRSAHRTQTRMAMQTSELTNYIVKQHGRY